MEPNIPKIVQQRESLIIHDSCLQSYYMVNTQMAVDLVLELYYYRYMVVCVKTLSVLLTIACQDLLHLVAAEVLQLM